MNGHPVAGIHKGETIKDKEGTGGNIFPPFL